MLGDLLKGFVDVEGQTRETIQKTLIKVAKELNCSYKDFTIMIKPINDNFDMKFYIFNISQGSPKLVREISLSEILGD